MKDREKQILHDIKVLYQQIQKDSEQSLQRCIELGSILEKQKEVLGHGNFIQWVVEFLPFSERSSRNYLCLYKNREKIKENNIKSLNEAYQLLKTKLPYSISKNNYLENPKESTIYTPQKVSEYIFSILSPVITPSTVLDVGIGKGSLSKPWKNTGIKIFGIDIDEKCSRYADIFISGKFEDLQKWEYEKPELVLSNPPFNNNEESKVLYPEIFLRKMVDLFGDTQKILMVVPMGFRLNQTLYSARWKWLIGSNLTIKSIISLPINIFETKFHTEILIFNINNLNPHYFLYE